MLSFVCLFICFNSACVPVCMSVRVCRSEDSSRRLVFPFCHVDVWAQTNVTICGAVLPTLRCALSFFFFFNFIHFINIWGDFWEQICQDCILRKKTCLELYFNYSTSHSHWIVRIYIDIVYVSFFGCCSLCIKDMMLSCMNTLRGRTLFPRECFPAVVRWTWLIVCALMLLCLALRIF